MTIRFEGVTKSFGARVILRDVSFEVAPGEILFVLGKSGMGKSVTLKHIVGVMKPDAGRVFVDTDEVSALPSEALSEVRRRCGMVFQQPALLDSLTVRENVAFGLRSRGSDAKQPHLAEERVEARVRETLALVKLGPEILDRRPPEISYGMQKRVSLARTLAPGPSYLLFDEPTTGLDPITTNAINDLIYSLSRQLRVTSVVVSHDMACALKIADRILVLDASRILALGTVPEIIGSSEPLVREFMAETLAALPPEERARIGLPETGGRRAMMGPARKGIIALCEELGGTALFVAEVLRTFARTRGNYGAIVDQIAFVSFRSISTVAFAGVFVGAILVLQFNLMLAQYDAGVFLGGLNTSAVVREVGPLIISFLLAGKIGAFTAAELGTMRVTEQIDAIECLGTNPLQYLVVPRFIAIICSSLILLVIGLTVSIAGAMLVAQVACGINPLQFASSIPRFTGPATLANGVFKSLLYGSIVATVACYKGYTAHGGARGVGRAVTQAAVYTNLYIVIANFLSGAVISFFDRLFFQVGG